MDYLYSLVPVSAADAVLPSLSSPTLTRGDAAMMQLVEELYNEALGIGTAAVADSDDGDGSAFASDSDDSDEEQDGAAGERVSAEGMSVNELASTLMEVEAGRVLRQGVLLRPLCAAVRWAFENLPRNVPVALVRLWGDRPEDTAAHLEVAYACTRLSRSGDGLRAAARSMQYVDVRTCLPLLCVCLCRLAQSASCRMGSLVVVRVSHTRAVCCPASSSRAALALSC